MNATFDDWVTTMIETREHTATDEWAKKVSLELYAENLEMKLRSFKRGTLLLMLMLAVETLAITYLLFVCYGGP